jgi:bifunctional DNase/RNase
LTHELVGNILQSLNARIEKVVVNDLKNMTFHAKIVLSQNGREAEVDSRPSDAIALAVQTGASIFVEEHVLEEAAGDYSE